MRSSVYRTYKENIKNSKSFSGFLKDDSFFCSLTSNKIQSLKNERCFYGKIPHSREFKIFSQEYPSAIPHNEAIQNDNIVATTNEFLLLDKYKKFGFMTPSVANFKLDSRYVDDHGVVSENLFGLDISYTPLYSYLTDKHVYVGSNITSKDNRIAYDEEHVEEFQYKSGYYGELIDIIENKSYYLREMTEHCYDQIIKSILISVFDFGDDDHFYNYYLCKKTNSAKFEELFVYDKESTAFSLQVALQVPFKEIKKETMNFADYNDYAIRIIDRQENFKDRFKALQNMFSEGLLEKKYFDFLIKIADYDYDNGARKVFEQTEIKPIQSQIDMFKFGAERAGILHEKVR